MKTKLFLLNILIVTSLFFIFSFLLIFTCKSQTENPDSLRFKKILITKENFSENTSKVVSVPVSEPVYTKLPTSGLEAYERLLKDYEYEKIKAKNQGLSTEELDNNIAQLNAKIIFEKNKNLTKVISVDRPKFIDTGNYEEDTRNYDIAKEVWIKSHPEEYRRIIESQLNTNESEILK